MSDAGSNGQRAARYVLELQGHPQFDGRLVPVRAHEIPSEFLLQHEERLLRFERAVGEVEAHEDADAVYLFVGDS